MYHLINMALWIMKVNVSIEIMHLNINMVLSSTT